MSQRKIQARQSPNPVTLKLVKFPNIFIMKLKGVAFVVDDVHKGRRLAFRYPGPPSFGKTDEFHSLDSTLFAKLFRPKTILCNAHFELMISSLHFISYPMTLTTGKSNELTMFNTILAFTHETDSSQLACLRQILHQISHSFYHEQQRIKFVSEQVHLLLNCEEELLHAEKQKGSKAVDNQTLIDMALSKSGLANTLKDIYHGLNESGMVQIVINSWIHLSLTLYRNSTNCTPDPIRPYHTLLLLEESTLLVKQLPPDASQQLQRLILHANPLHTFQELQLTLSIPFEQLIRLAAHLVYWGKARIIVTMTKHGIYQVTSQADVQVQSRIAREFKLKFPSTLLHEILSRFSATRTLAAYLKKMCVKNRNEFLQMLVRIFGISLWIFYLILLK